MQRGNRPYIKLGQKLMQIRQRKHESLPDVSGAIELDVDIVDSYEKGETRPSQSVLDMIISHFDVTDTEADELWQLAGYGTSDKEGMEKIDFDQPHMPIMPTIVITPMDNKVLYTDKVNISVNTQGVVMSFMQESLNPGQGIPVSRIGMSIDHAKKVLEVLNTAITKFESNKK